MLWCGLIVGFGCVVGLVSGCASPVFDLTLPQSAEFVVEHYDDRPWATVLRENVKGQLVDYRHLAEHRQPLDAYLRTVSEIGPEIAASEFARRESRVCYYINVYNAGLLAAVLKARVPDSIHGLRFGPVDSRFGMRVDGRHRLLADLRRLALAESDGDMRVVFALCDGAVGSPPLHDQPFRPEGLEETLRLLSQRAMDNRLMVSIDHERQALKLSTVLASRREAFISYYKSRTAAHEATMLNVVLHFAGRVRRQWLNTAVGYPVRIIPFDRSLNRWTPEGGHGGD
ncbi:MAG: DUF547 domain-containing protein [Phycisphaerae bacterium]